MRKLLTQIVLGALLCSNVFAWGWVYVAGGGKFEALDTFTDTNGTALTAHVSDTKNITWESGSTTWTIQSNTANNDPGLDADIAPNSTCTTDVARTEVDDTSSWTNGEGAAQEYATFASDTEGTETNGTHSLHLVADSANDKASVTITTVVGLPYRVTVIYKRNVATDPGELRAGASSGAVGDGILQLTATSFTSASLTFVASTTTTFITINEDGVNNNSEMWIDTLIVNPLTLNEVIASAAMGITDGIFDVDITIPTIDDGQAGFVIALDDKDTPANFVWGFFNREGMGISVRVYKLVAGVGTSLIATTTTYAAGATLRVELTISGSDLLVDVTYNSNTIGTQQTISNAGIVGNARHGIMNVDASNSLDNFEVNPTSLNSIFDTGVRFVYADDYLMEKAA